MSKNDNTKDPGSWPAYTWRFVNRKTAPWILAIALVLVVVLQSLGYNPIHALLKRVPYINKLVVDEDPLGIVGKWTYTTSFNTEEDSKKHKYKKVRGVNFLINFDGCRYAMQGQRTGYVEKNSDDQLKDYPTPLSI